MQICRLRYSADFIEQIERATLRNVFHALTDFIQYAKDAFTFVDQRGPDVVAEEILRAAMEHVGVPYNYVNLPGRVDYKKARWFFHPDFSIRQALMIDAKAEKTEDNFSIQSGQTSMRIRFYNGKGKRFWQRGGLPKVIEIEPPAGPLLTTTIVAKFNYSEQNEGQKEVSRQLRSISLAAIPNGYLFLRYNRNPHDHIWQTGKNATSRGEEFRVRVSKERLAAKMRWRVQEIPASGPANWVS